MNRRELLKTVTASAALTLTTPVIFANESRKPETKFRYSLNTSTISGQNLGVMKYIDIATRAGYDCIELWIQDSGLPGLPVCRPPRSFMHSQLARHLAT